MKLKSKKTCAQNRYKNTGCKGFRAMERPDFCDPDEKNNTSFFFCRNMHLNQVRNTKRENIS
jgi:hypothetical protein